MNLSSNNSAIIKQTVRKYLENAEVMLFGSRARNEAGLDSDYDILIKIAHSLPVKEKIELRSEIRKSLLTHGIRSDIMIQSSQEIEAKRKLPGHIIRNLMKDVIVL